MVYRTAPFSMTLKAPNPDFKIRPFFDAAYLQNGCRLSVLNLDLKVTVLYLGLYIVLVVRTCYAWLVFMLLTCDLFAIAKFLLNVRQKTDARYSYRLDVRSFVRPSVRWYCVKTAQRIVKLSSLSGSPMILVFWGPKFSPKFQGNTRIGALNARG